LQHYQMLCKWLFIQANYLSTNGVTSPWTSDTVNDPFFSYISPKPNPQLLQLCRFVVE
jgi:inhibitor of KinA sporulation pathway (predicted exonuclease)